MNQKTMDMLQGHFGRRRRVLAPVSWRKGLEVYRSISADNRDELIFIISNAQLEQLQDVEEVLQRRVHFRSPNLALLSEAGTLPDERGYWICRMELASSFRNIIRENNSNPRKLILFVQQVAMGLVVVHRNSGFHGDLRPSTIFVKHVGGQDKAFSMGMALDLWVNPPDIVELSSKEVSRFVPPELTLGEELGPSTDIYSIGVLLYHVVCGGHPFDGDSPRDVVISHTHGFSIDKPNHIDSDMWKIIEKCLQQTAERRIDIEDLINQLQPYTIGRRAVYTSEYTKSQQNVNTQNHTDGIERVNYDNIVRDFPEEDSYSQEKLDFRFPSSISEHQNGNSYPNVSQQETNNSNISTTDNLERELSREHQIELMDTVLLKGGNKIIANQGEQILDDETQPLENTDQITDADIQASNSKRGDLFGRVLQGDSSQNQPDSMNRPSEELPSSEEHRKNVLLSLDPLEADFSEEFSAAEFQFGAPQSRDSLQNVAQTSQAESIQGKYLDKDIPSEEYSYEYSSEIFDPEISESEDVTALPLAVFVQPSEKKLEVTDLEDLSEEGMSEDPLSNEQLSGKKESRVNTYNKHQDLEIATENQKMVERAILQRGHDNRNDNGGNSSQGVGNQHGSDFEFDSDQTMISEAEDESEFIFEQTLKGVNVQPSSKSSGEQLNSDNVQQRPLHSIDVHSGREVSFGQTNQEHQTNQRNQSSAIEQRNMGRMNHKSTPRVELESILPLEERRIQEDDLSELSSVVPQTTNIKQSLFMFAVGFFALGGLYIFIYSLILK